MFRRRYLLPASALFAAIAATATAEAQTQDAGLGRTDAAISGRGDAAELAEAGIPDAGAIPSAEKLPADAPPVLNDREGEVSLQPRGAATLVGLVSYSSGRLMIDLVGAAPGYYRVRLLGGDQCPSAPAPSEMVTGELDESRRSRPAPAFVNRGLLAGEVRVGDDGRGRFQLSVGRGELPKNAKSIAVLLEERPGAVNPSVADQHGLVACGSLPVSAAG